MVVVLDSLVLWLLLDWLVLWLVCRLLVSSVLRFDSGFGRFGLRCWFGVIVLSLIG